MIPLFAIAMAVTATADKLQWEKAVARSLDGIAKASIDLLLKDSPSGYGASAGAFYAHLLARLPRLVSLDTATAAVGLKSTGEIYLIVNPNFWLGLTDSERAAVLKHEVLHMVFRHVTRLVDEKKHQIIWNLAADLVVNQEIENFDLPKGAIELQTFPDLHLPAKDSADAYYKELKKLNDESGPRPTGPPGGSQPDRPPDGGLTMPGGEGEKQGQPGGGGAGDYSDSSAPVSKEALDRLIKEGWSDDHDFWNPSDEEGDATEPKPGGWAKGRGAARELADKELERRVIEAWDKTPMASRGLLPGFVKGMVQDAREALAPKVNWKRRLSLWIDRTGLTQRRKTRMRPSRRFGPDALKGAGVTLPHGYNPEGSRTRPEKRLAVIIDTSGSMSADDYNAVFSEMKHLYRNPGVNIRIYEADTDVARVYDWDGKPLTEMHGGGGTDFTNPLLYALEKDGRPPDGIIYMTDGGAPAPSAEDVRTRVPVLWIVTPGWGHEHLAGHPNRQSLSVSLGE